MRVVSVLPSATEIVYALGHGAELVGRSAECDYPGDARRLPVVMRPRAFDTDRPSAEIDARVRADRASDESLYQLDVDRLRRLAPDLLLTQDLCGVCSVTEVEVAAACATAGIRPRTVSLTPRTLGGVWDSIAAVGRALGDPSAGHRLSDALRSRAAPRPGSPRGRVAVVEWLDPPILAGLWVPEMVVAAGAAYVGPGPGDVGLRTSWEALRRDPPEYLVLSPCSFSVERTLAELGSPRLSEAISAVPTKAPPLVADEAYFSRPGPRLADGVDLLRGLLDGAIEDPPMPVLRWGPSSPEVSA